MFFSIVNTLKSNSRKDNLFQLDPEIDTARQAVCFWYPPLRSQNAAPFSLGYGYAGLRRFFDTISPSNTPSRRGRSAGDGVVNKVLANGELVQGYADTIAGNAPHTINAIKQIAIEALNHAQ